MDFDADCGRDSEMALLLAEKSSRPGGLSDSHLLSQSSASSGNLLL